MQRISDKLPGKSDGTTWRNRIVGEGTESPDQLLANPQNWRVHSRFQQDVLASTLDQVGWIQRVIVNRSTGFIVDGHLRVTLAMRHGEPSIPVQYVELTPDEEALVLAVLDPIAGLAVADDEKLRELMAEIESDDAAIQAMMDSIKAGVTLPDDGEWGDAFGNLPNGGKAPFQQMTFTVHDTQAEQIKIALGISKKMGGFDTENENSNGNALARICETFVSNYGQG